MFLQYRDVPADRSGRDVQLFGCARDILQPRRGLESA